MTPKNVKNALTYAFCAIALGVGIFYTVRIRSARNTQKTPSAEVKAVRKNGDARIAEKTGQARKTAEANRAVRKNARKTAVGTNETETAESGTDEITKALDDALDSNNKAGILAEAKKLKKNPNPEVRSQVAFALDWLGVEGLEELTSMLGDSDPDVAKDVLDYWESALSSINDQTTKANLLVSAIESQSDSLSNDSFQELIDTARFELDEPTDLDAFLTILDKTDEKNTARMEILRENINALTGEEANTKSELQSTGQKALAEQKAEAAQEAQEAAADAAEEAAAANPSGAATGGTAQ